MTQLNSKSIQAILQEALHKDGDILKEIVRRIIHHVMKEERDQQAGVLSHQRDDMKRKANRNGYKPRSFNTRVGNLLLAKPQIREFAFRTQLFENYQRSEKALLAAICQMVADAVYFFLRENHQVVSRPALVTVGVDTHGYRKILGVNVALEGSYLSYRDHLRALKERGLKQVDLTISDEHKGLLKAQQEVFPGVPHQRCICHFMRNILSKVPYKERPRLASYLKQIYNSPNQQMASSIAQLIVKEYRNTYPKVSRLLEEELESTLTYLSYFQHHWRKIRTTNLIEGGLNKDLKQRSKVIGIFPNRESCLRYLSLRLMEIDEEWQTGRKYMKMPEDDQGANQNDTL